jgi:PAS domain S-box-containing protein
MKHNISLRTKLLIGVVGIILLLILPITFTVRHMSYKSLESQFHKRAVTLANQVSARIAGHVLTLNTMAVRLAILKIKEDENLSYVFAVDSRGEILEHTFEKGLPVGLLEANQLSRGRPYNLQHIESEEGIILDIAAPLLGGTLGSIRIGISEEPLLTDIAHVTWLIAGITASVLLFGIVLAFVFAKITTRPIHELIAVSDAVGAGDLKQRAKIITRDEIGRLAVTFNKMTESLENTLSDLEQIYNHAPAGMRIVDKDFNVVSQNEAMGGMTGIGRQEAVGKKCYELFSCRWCHTDDCPVAQILKGKTKIDAEADQETADGVKIPYRVMAAPFRDQDGRVVGIIEAFNNISENRELIERLRQETKNLEQSNHVLEAYNSIVTTLNAGMKLDSLLEEIIGKIARRTDSQLGVVYLYEEEEKNLRPVSTYAIDKNLIGDGFKLGHGLPGQAAAERKMVAVRDIPEDYFRVSSGSGERIPRNVVCLPIIFQNHLIGVLELGSLHDFMDKELEFLGVIADQLGVGIANLLSYTQVKNLAAELKEKNKILASQNEELQSQSEELIAQSEELQSQTEELESQKKMLEEKTHQAQEADRLKSEFLSNMSHELRTPLNAALGMTRLMTDGSAGPPTEKQKEYLEIIERNGENLLLLINDILDLSRIESGKVEITVSVIHLRMLVSGVAASLKPLIDEKGLAVNIDIDDHIVLQSDADKLRQIVVNLLGNAVKFTDQGTIAVVAAEEKDDQKDIVKISVTDTGIGIKEEHSGHIFDAFRQVDGSMTRRYGGTGLGLNICWKLSHLLGGKIEAASEFGKGSTFTVTLPKELTAPKGPITADWKEKIKEALLDETKAPPKVTYEGEQFSKELLIIDDDPVVVRELRTILKDENYWLRFAFNGAEGLLHIEERVPDLILLDLQMPEVNGFQLLEKMEANERFKRIPTIVLTALDVTDEERNRLGDNVKAVIVKGGTDKSALIGQIRGILYGRGRVPEKTEKAEPHKRKRKKGSPPFKILIVEDNPDNMILIRETLRPSGHTIYTAENGARAIVIARSELPDLILMDIQMPGMSGYEASKKVREIEPLKDVPIIALTARAMKGEREAILKRGFDDYLAKPVRPKNLIAKVDEWLSG